LALENLLFPAQEQQQVRKASKKIKQRCFDLLQNAGSKNRSPEAVIIQTASKIVNPNNCEWHFKVPYAWTCIKGITGWQEHFAKTRLL
jgi:hypothetical protein